MIIYQETSIVGSLFLRSLSLFVSLYVCVFRFSYACFCYSPSSNTILLANSHQFIHRRRERDRARGADKTFIEVVLCDGLSVVRSFVRLLFSFSFFFSFLSSCSCYMLKENFIIFLSLRLIFFIDGTFVPFPRDSTNELNYFVNEKRANTEIILSLDTHKNIMQKIICSYSTLNRQKICSLSFSSDHSFAFSDIYARVSIIDDYYLLMSSICLRQ